MCTYTLHTYIHHKETKKKKKKKGRPPPLSQHLLHKKNIPKKKPPSSPLLPLAPILHLAEYKASDKPVKPEVSGEDLNENGADEEAVGFRFVLVVLADLLLRPPRATGGCVTALPLTRPAAETHLPPALPHAALRPDGPNARIRAYADREARREGTEARAKTGGEVREGGVEGVG